MHIELSAIDRERFGVITAKARNLVHADDVAAALRFCADHEVALLIARVDAAHLPVVHALEVGGGRLCDTLVHYRLSALHAKPAAADADADTDAVRLREAAPGDAQRLLAITREAFTGYHGHYHADPRLPAARADEVYVSWCAMFVEGRAPRASILVAEDDTGVCGFLTLQENEREMQLVLSALTRRAEGRGVYRRLIEGGVARGVAAGKRMIVTSTQITNLAVQRIWTRQGFHLYNVEYTLHLWTTPGPV
jgi:hypothetical protein